MKRLLLICMLFLFVGLLISSAQRSSSSLKIAFKNPPKQYKPMPFWHINDSMTTEGIWQQMSDAKEKAGFAGVSVLPLAPKKDGKGGTLPKFLTEDYLKRYQDVIDAAKKLEMQVILYDDNDFPSGMAGGKLGELFPEHTMKRLDKIEREITGPAVFSDSVPKGRIMSVVAMNDKTFERIEIGSYSNNGLIKWDVPAGKWKIMFFTMVKDSWHKAFPVVDYLDTTAVRHMINLTYDVYKERFGSYFGNVIQMTFFDDVGFWRHPRTWTGRFNEKFQQLNGYDPRPWYPALWYNIGPETESVRHAFFNTRAELLADGFPKLVGEWTKKNGLKDTGHPPGNYDPTPIDMNADIFKFYRHTQVPLMDAIIDYQFGQNGHKLISSAADYYDKSVVATEVYGAFKENSFDSLMLYRPVMELFIRGVNFVIPHGMWYNPQRVGIPPLVSPYSEKIATALPAYSRFVGRSCLLLQGGRKVVDVGVLYPFEELAGYFRFDNPENIRQGFYVSPETDYQKISGLLTNEIRQDFTFIHPEFFLDNKYQIGKGRIKLENAENMQEYKALVITGSKVISYKTLEKIRDFYRKGGLVISTTMLPFKSSEMGQDQKVISLVKEIFGVNPLERNTVISKRENNSGGKSIFIPKPDKSNLREALINSFLPDVRFVSDPKLSTDFGKFSYVHKIKNGKDIFFFANSSDEPIETDVFLRGKLKLENWDPHTGLVSAIKGVEYVTESGSVFTKCRLKLPPVKSVFWMSK